MNDAARSGIDTRFIDATVRPQDDLYRHLNGRWLDSFVLPADTGSYGAFDLVEDATQEQLHGMLQSLGDVPDADVRKLAALHASFMDEARLESLGVAPLLDDFLAIDALGAGDARAVARLIARFNRRAVGAPYAIEIDPDPKDSARYAVIIDQGGLGLPDRDYYLADDAAIVAVRARYVAHIAKLFQLARDPGDPVDADDASDAGAARRARLILGLETALARLQWSRVANRDPQNTYHKIAIADLDRMMPAFAWTEYLEAAGIAGRVDAVIVRQPDYLEGLGRLLSDTPLAVWKDYFRWHLLAAAAPWLGRSFFAERFAFAGSALRGIPENRPRWKRGIALLNRCMGEALGRLYVETFFPPQHKARMETLVCNLLEAFRREIAALDWMSPGAKRGALAKLSKMLPKIGYPDVWRDYGALAISRDDLWGNVARAAEFEHRRGVAKLGRPIDRREWFMPPQVVNAYYNPVMNEVVFPAAILQPPFFDAAADDAVNYGAIGAVIGHEISHGFDDKGSQFDADGNLCDWFSAADHARFADKTRSLVAQYAACEAVPGVCVDGELTLGENIGDNCGLAIAYKAYVLSLEGGGAPVIDGFSGEQRFYLGWAQMWRAKVRRDEALERIRTDPHSPPAVRGGEALRNQPGFHAAFDVRPGDRMYTPPERRVILW